MRAWPRRTTRPPAGASRAARSRRRSTGNRSRSQATTSAAPRPDVTARSGRRRQRRQLRVLGAGERPALSSGRAPELAHVPRQGAGAGDEGLSGGPIARDFAQVFYTSAFADHFLQDAFSAGHAGFNRPSTGAVASKAFHDIWNRSGRLVKSPTGSCWVQYGDGKLAFASDTARFQIDAAEKASVYDVLAAFITGKRDPGRETRPVLYMPAEITPNPLPGPVWGPRGEEPPVEGAADPERGGRGGAAGAAAERDRTEGRFQPRGHRQHLPAAKERARPRVRRGDGPDRRHQQPGPDQRRRRLLGGGRGGQRDEGGRARGALQPPAAFADVVAGFLGGGIGLRLHAARGAGGGGARRRSWGSSRRRFISFTGCGGTRSAHKRRATTSWGAVPISSTAT